MNISGESSTRLRPMRRLLQRAVKNRWKRRKTSTLSWETTSEIFKAGQKLEVVGLLGDQQQPLRTENPEAGQIHPRRKEEKARKGEVAMSTEYQEELTIMSQLGEKSSTLPRIEGWITCKETPTSVSMKWNPPILTSACINLWCQKPPSINKLQSTTSCSIMHLFPWEIIIKIRLMAPSKLLILKLLLQWGMSQFPNFSGAKLALSHLVARLREGKTSKCSMTILSTFSIKSRPTVFSRLKAAP